MAALVKYLCANLCVWKVTSFIKVNEFAYDLLSKKHGSKMNNKSVFLHKKIYFKSFALYFVVKTRYIIFKTTVKQNSYIFQFYV
jgi:hypothetical protein